MGVGRSFGEAFAKALAGAGIGLPRGGRALLSVRDQDKAKLIPVARELARLGFSLFATDGTSQTVKDAGISCTRVNKVKEGRPHIVDMIKNEEFSLIVNTTEDKQAIKDSAEIRRAALQHKVSYTTTISGAEATCLALRHLDAVSVNCLQDLHG